MAKASGVHPGEILLTEFMQLRGLIAYRFVMVGERAQEMQLAHWLPATTIHWLDGRIESHTKGAGA